MSPVISKRTAKALLRLAQDSGLYPTCEAELQKALAPKRSVKANRVRKAAKKATKTQRARDLRTALIERSDASCELCGAAACASPRRFDVHHALGRKGLEDGLHNCLFICEFCHERVTNPGDGAPGGFASQAVVFTRLGHHDTAAELLKKAEFARSKIDARSALTRGEP